MKKHISTEEWVAMYREIGMDKDQMRRWHKVFEARHPEAHQAFLEWLGMPAKEIAEVRAESR